VEIIINIELILRVLENIFMKSGSRTSICQPIIQFGSYVQKKICYLLWINKDYLHKIFTILRVRFIIRILLITTMMSVRASQNDHPAQ